MSAIYGHSIPKFRFFPARNAAKDQRAGCGIFAFYPSAHRTCMGWKMSILTSRRCSSLLGKSFFTKDGDIFFHCSCMIIKDLSVAHERPWRSPTQAFSLPSDNNNPRDHILHNSEDSKLFGYKPKAFKNRFLNIVRLGSILNKAAESFFRSEIRRRLFITAVLLIISRVGHFVPLPGFDRREIPQNYLNFTHRPVGNSGYSAPELKLSLFQLGLSPQIVASVIMQALCHVVPSLVRLRKESLDGYEKIKSYIWWMSLAFAILEAFVLACGSLSYSIYATSNKIKHVMISTVLLTCGAMITLYTCDKISESGFGEGSSLVICVGILTGYTDTLYNIICQLSGSIANWWVYILGLLIVFIMVAMLSVIVTEGCRKIKLHYYGFKLASTSRDGSPISEVEPYIPFNINPSGMQPVLTTTYLLAFPAIIASMFNSPFWIHLKNVLDPETSVGAEPWVYYSIFAFFVFILNIHDIANMPKEISEYLNKIGARVPKVKPGKATIKYLSKIQASTRFWGGLLLSILATASTILDHYLRRINKAYAVEFTSVLIIVGSIIELRRSYQAYNLMPALSRALRRYGA